MFLTMTGAQLTPHLPAYPEKQQAASEQQSDDCQKIDGDGSKQDAEHRCRQNADNDRLAALRSFQAGSSKADDDGVVAGENEVDSNDLQQSRQTGRCENIHIEVPPGYASSVLAS